MRRNATPKGVKKTAPAFPGIMIGSQALSGFWGAGLPVLAGPRRQDNRQKLKSPEPGQQNRTETGRSDSRLGAPPRGSSPHVAREAHVSHVSPWPATRGQKTDLVNVLLDLTASTTPDVQREDAPRAPHVNHYTCFTCCTRCADSTCPLFTSRCSLVNHHQQSKNRIKTLLATGQKKAAARQRVVAAADAMMASRCVPCETSGGLGPANERLRAIKARPRLNR